MNAPRGHPQGPVVQELAAGQKSAWVFPRVDPFPICREHPCPPYGCFVIPPCPQQASRRNPVMCLHDEPSPLTTQTSCWSPAAPGRPEDSGGAKNNRSRKTRVIPHCLRLERAIYFLHRKIGAGMSLTSATAPAQAHQSDLRLHHRYPVELELRYTLLNQEQPARLGSGRSLNISSGGVLFNADGVLPPSGHILLTMKWPYLLDSAVALELVISGRIVRSYANAVAVKAEHHEFRTAGARFRKSKVEPVAMAASPSHDNA